MLKKNFLALIISTCLLTASSPTLASLTSEAQEDILNNKDAVRAVTLFLPLNNAMKWGMASH